MNTVKEQAEMLESLMWAVTQAGGNPSIVKREDMTLRELVKTLGPNGVRFYYDKRERK